MENAILVALGGRLYIKQLSQQEAYLLGGVSSLESQNAAEYCYLSVTTQAQATLDDVNFGDFKKT